MPSATTAEGVMLAGARGGMVTVGRTTPPGPIVTSWPSIETTVGVAPGPIPNVVPLMTAAVEPMANVKPAAVTEDKGGGGKATVVLAALMPPGPRVKVWP